MKAKTEPTDFFRIVGERIRKFPTVRIGRTTEQLLQKEIVKRMGVTDMNALRDRFEGQQFLENHRSRLFANLAVREFLGEPHRSRTLELIEENDNHIEINGRRHEVVSIPFGALPQFKRDDYPNPVILVFQRDIFSMYIFGIIEPEDIVDENNYVTNSSSREFIAFDKIKEVSNGF